MSSSFLQVEHIYGISSLVERLQILKLVSIYYLYNILIHLHCSLDCEAMNMFVLVFEVGCIYEHA